MSQTSTSPPEAPDPKAPDLSAVLSQAMGAAAKQGGVVDQAMGAAARAAAKQLSNAAPSYPAESTILLVLTLAYGAVSSLTDIVPVSVRPVVVAACGLLSAVITWQRHVTAGKGGGS